MHRQKREWEPGGAAGVCAIQLLATAGEHPKGACTTFPKTSRSHTQKKTANRLLWDVRTPEWEANAQIPRRAAGLPLPLLPSALKKRRTNVRRPSFLLS